MLPRAPVSPRCATEIVKSELQNTLGACRIYQHVCRAWCGSGTHSRNLRFIFSELVLLAVPQLSLRTQRQVVYSFSPPSNVCGNGRQCGTAWLICASSALVGASQRAFSPRMSQVQLGILCARIDARAEVLAAGRNCRIYLYLEMPRKASLGRRLLKSTPKRFVQLWRIS